MNPKKVGLIGLGNIGGGMCTRLIERGYDVVACDISEAAAARAATAGARVVATAQDVAMEVSVIVSCLQSPDVVLAVFTGPDGVLAAAAPGMVIVETSTIDPLTIRALADAAKAKQVRVLDVALSGGPELAANGDLVFQVGGDEDLIEQHRELLETMAKKLNRTGELGSAKTVKLVNNLMSLGNLAIAAEAFELGVQCGMDPRQLHEILSVSGGRSNKFNYDFKRVLDDDFRPTFTTRLAVKDLGLIQELAARTGYESVLAPVIAARYQKAIDSGFGEDDFTSVVKLYRQTDGSMANSDQGEEP